HVAHTSTHVSISLAGGEQAPAPGTEGDASLVASGMVEGQVDFDLVALPADVEFHPAGAADAAGGADHTGQGRPLLDQFHIMGTEEQARLAGRGGAGRHTDGAAANP